MHLAQKKIHTKIGDLYLVASDKGIRSVFWQKQNIGKSQSNSVCEILLSKAEQQIHEYLGSERTTFDLPLDMVGTDFQKTVWTELLKIPFGETRSYKEIALKIKSANASRAVGTANGKNPLCLIIPCHRVITSSGELGGYSGGIKIKKHLLQLEKTK